MQSLATEMEGATVVDLTTPRGTALSRMFSPLERLTRYDDEDCLLGKVYIFGVPHHVTFVRVEYHPDGIQYGTLDPHDRLTDILTGQEGAPSVVELPGFKGDWVVGVSPYR